MRNDMSKWGSREIALHTYGPVRTAEALDALDDDDCTPKRRRFWVKVATVTVLCLCIFVLVGDAIHTAIHDYQDACNAGANCAGPEDIDAR